MNPALTDCIISELKRMRKTRNELQEALDATNNRIKGLMLQLTGGKSES